MYFSAPFLCGLLMAGLPVSSFFFHYFGVQFVSMTELPVSWNSGSNDPRHLIVRNLIFVAFEFSLSFVDSVHFQVSVNKPTICVFWRQERDLEIHPLRVWH